MTDTTNGWPGKPGVPGDPGLPGAHWLKGYTEDAWMYDGDGGWWGPGYSHKLDAETVAARYSYLSPVLSHDEATALQARVAELEGALKDAAASVGEWGAYASQYLQEKWGLPGEVARYVAIAEGKKE